MQEFMERDTTSNETETIHAHVSAIHPHRFSAEWLRSNVVSALISLISGTSAMCRLIY